MEIIDAIILGVVEGLTEFLPVSSTGHLILTGRILNLPDAAFIQSFMIIIQFGAIAAVLALYWKEFWRLENLKKIIAGSIPTAIIGFGLYKIIKNNLLGSELVVVIALIVGGLILIAFENFYKGPDIANEKVRDITYREAFTVGIFQTLAVIPGVSRSAASIIGGLALGIPRETIVRFSFMLAVPTILGAAGLDAFESRDVILQSDMTLLLVGFAVSFVVAIFAMRFLIRFIAKNNFISFGVYRIVIGLAFLTIMI